MSETPPDLTASFARHVNAFHASLPADEQPLLEALLALAARAQPEEAATDTGGFIGLNGLPPGQPVFRLSFLLPYIEQDNLRRAITDGTRNTHR